MKKKLSMLLVFCLMLGTFVMSPLSHAKTHNHVYVKSWSGSTIKFKHYTEYHNSDTEEWTIKYSKKTIKARITSSTKYYQIYGGSESNLKKISKSSFKSYCNSVHFIRKIVVKNGKVTKMVCGAAAG